MRVTDYGPSCFVENDAQRAVLDASPAVCHALTGGSSCGWSDHFLIKVTVATNNRPLGFYNATQEEINDIMAKGRELERRIETEQICPVRPL